MRQLIYPRFAILVLTLIAFLWGSRADAHAIGAECKLVDKKVEVEAYYDDDTPARDALVTVQNLAEKVVSEGRTDKGGRWSFARPEPGKYVISVDAGAGHRTQIKISIPAPDRQASAAPASSSSSVDPSPFGKEEAGKPSEPITVSDGPDRRAFTTIPWLKIGLGVTLTALLALAFCWRKRFYSTPRNMERKVV